MIQKLISMSARIVSELSKSFTDVNPLPQGVQRQIYLTYGRLAAEGGLTFRDAGFRVFSQSDEDGLLLYIYSLIGFTNRRLVDMACGKPIGANSTNLILNWGFHGLLVEGDKENISASRQFYKNHPDTAIYPPSIVTAWINAENINDLILDNGFSGEVDLLSLDIDGVDYWLWKNLRAISPRVVMVEYQDCFPADQALTVPYRADFNRHNYHHDYFGASLAAFVKLAKSKGYRLIGCNRYCYNAFFVRNDLVCSQLPEIDPEDCLVHPKVTDHAERKRASLSAFPWEEV